MFVIKLNLSSISIKIMCYWWEHLLKEIGINDNFFFLGYKMV